MNEPLKQPFSSPLSKRKRTTISPLSPIGLALASYVLFVVATLIPPGAYEKIMLERDSMFLNIQMHLFMAGCLLCFVVGAYLASRTKYSEWKIELHLPRGSAYIAIPVVMASLVNLLSISIFLKSNHGLLTAWITDAKAVKQDFDGSGGLTEALPLLFGVCWWAYLRLLELRSISNRRHWVLSSLIGGAFFLAVFTALMKVARYDLMPGIFGIALIYFFNKFRNSVVPLRRYLVPLSKFGGGMIAVFIVFAWLRGNSESSTILNNVMGYTVASYNRLAVLLEGGVRFPYGGTGTYAFRFLGNVPFFSRWIDFAGLMGMPATEVVWLSEFPAIFRAGLDGRYIWVSAFGYIYSDIGFFVFPYLFIVGILSGWLWKSLSQGKALGVVLYPWFAFSIVFWFGSNYLAYPRLLTLAAAGLLLTAYERFARGLSLWRA